MRVFVTGATGFIGSAVVQELIGAGHQVLGLARSDAAAKSLAAAGAEVHRGDLEDLDSLRSGAAVSDGVIHTAFIHDFSKFKEVCEIDRRAIEALGAALAGSDRPLIVTSGTALLPPGRLATEDNRAAFRLRHLSRALRKQAAAALAARGVRASVVRLPPSVHGDGDHGFVPTPHRHRARKGRFGLCGRRAQPLARGAPARCRPALPAGARERLRRSPVSRGRRRGRAVPGHRRRDRPPPERAGRQQSPPRRPPTTSAGSRISRRSTCPASSERTRELLGWQPKQPGLIADLDRPRYFET